MKTQGDKRRAARILPSVDDLLTLSPAQRAISVTELNRQAKKLLEQGIARVWVEGEVSNLARPASGHIYFTLKDETAQIRCAWFRQRQRGPAIRLKNGDQMLAFGKVSLFEARGDYQLIVEELEEAGEGELRRRFEALKKKLAAEGLFDPAHKIPLPAVPQCIGVVTSPTGAAVRDILTVLRRRFPAVPVVIYPTAVQGETAAAQIAAAIAIADRRKDCDVLLVARGGGSLEDLWAFNEEIVARAIFDCSLPVVSAIGHEVDFTIADFVADVRAPTPSGAAELVVPDQADWRRQLAASIGRIAIASRRYLDDRHQRIDWLARRLQRASPAGTVARQSEWLKNLRQVMIAAIRHDLNLRGRSLDGLRARLLQRSPALSVEQSKRRLAAARQRLNVAGTNKVSRLQQQLGLASRALDSVSPLATLDRGYAIVTDKATGRILSDAAKVPVGASIRARLATGSLEATVSKSDKTK